MDSEANKKVQVIPDIEDDWTIDNSTSPESEPIM
jgi:hypothetical protein